MRWLDINGPGFLLVYLLYGVCLTAAVRWWSRKDINRNAQHTMGGMGSSAAVLTPADVNKKDPFEVGYLVDGARGALRAALAQAFSQGWLTSEQGTVVNGNAEPPAPVHPLINMLMVRGPGKDAHRLLIDEELLTGTESHMKETRGRLVALGYYRESGDVLLNTLQVAAALVLVEGLGLIRVGLSLRAGHDNVAFLLFCMLGFGIFIPVLVRVKAGVTAKGRKAGAQLAESLRPWRASLATRKTSTADDWALMAGIYGLGACAVAPQAAWASDITPALVATSSSCGSASCGSSSSCSGGGDSGGGSSCGGGGCGGCGGGGGGD